MRKAVRQGDVLLVPKDGPTRGKFLPATDGRNIVAEGEVTGHHHSLDPANTAVFMGEFGDLELMVAERDQITHQEHHALPVELGGYDVELQRQAGYQRMVNSVSD